MSLRFVALGAVLVLSGCGSSGSDAGGPAHADAGSPEIGSDAPEDVGVAPGSLVDPATGEPADYACNGSFRALTPEPTAAHPFHVASIRFQTAIGAELVAVDDQGTAQGTPVTSDGSGDATLMLPSHAFASWQVFGLGCPDTCVPTYQFAELTHSLAELGNGALEHALGWDIDDFVGAASHAHVELAVGMAVGTVVDCAGARVENATIVVSDAAGNAAVPCDLGASQALPCFAYLDSNRNVNTSLEATGESGQFLVFAAKTTITAKAFGVVAGTTEPVAIGSTTLPLFEQSVSLGTVYPR